MATTKRLARATPARRSTPPTVPIMVIPEQSAKAIETRMLIRESLHDARAITIAPSRSRRRKP